MSLYETIGKKEYLALLADPMGADPIAIPCLPGNGEIAPGTVMYATENGMYAPAAAANATDNNALVVLAETVDTDADATVAANAKAYRAAKLVDDAVKLKDGEELTDAIRLTLRKQNIVLCPIVGGKTFENAIG